MNAPDTAPKDGQCVLLRYHVRHFNRYWQRRNLDDLYVRDGEKWEQCRWRDDSWTPWCGTPGTSCSLSIPQGDVIGWLPMPEVVE